MRYRWALLAALVVAYAALLRLDAYTEKYGPLDSPAWARVLTTHGAAAGKAVRLHGVGWAPIADPYVGGDPVNYIRYAREMTSFYQAHVREPVFLAITRAYLWLLDGRDAAVSFASATGSTLAVLGTFLLASMLVPRVAALAAAAAVAMDHEIVTWSVDGWRDDVFMATVVWTAWAFLRLRERPSRERAALLGVLAAAACLTRITAVTFILPALVWLVVDAARADRRPRAAAAGLAFAVCAALVAPYLINCARETGDPLYAINYHTVYYRAGEGQPAEGHVSAAAYLGRKLADDPFHTIDTGFTGLFVHPFASKWTGLGFIFRQALPVVFWAAAAGLVLLLWHPPGRLLLVILYGSLVPYAFTWNIGDGGAFRFTMHAYPLYFVAGAYAFIAAGRAIAALVRTRDLKRPSPREVLVASTVVLAVAVAAWGYYTLPWFVVHEALADREDVSIEAGGRSDVFFERGWSDPRNESIDIRVSEGDRSTVTFPLPERRDYDIILRVDPVAPGAQQRLGVIFNGHFVSRLRLAFDPERVGSYRIPLRADHVRDGENTLTLVPEPTVLAASAGPRFSWIEPDSKIGVRLWYVRVLSDIHRDN